MNQNNSPGNLSTSGKTVVLNLRLTRLADQMRSTAELMRQHGGFDGELHKHALELEGAAGAVENWVRGIAEESGL